ncbi:HU family DNA-binding protein [Microlunatus sp. GCM10028923]|uniref:HU family DNA-binding protein n=1 Tax=Microlunatus sp. GCM10028923 TaxID=3273400 RepID=UPI003613E1FA
MAKAELVGKIAAETGLEQGVVDRVLSGLDRALIDIVRAGDELRLAGLLVLDVVDRAERQGRNPQTGEPMTIPAARQVRLRPGTRLKQAARG